MSNLGASWKWNPESVKAAGPRTEALWQNPEYRRAHMELSRKHGGRTWQEIYGKYGKKADMIKPKAPWFSRAAPLIGKAIGIAGAGMAGWDVGRTLGQTPLMTDPSMTYDDYYQDLFTEMLLKKKREQAMQTYPVGMPNPELRGL
jgi:hypothetical protein